MLVVTAVVGAACVVAISVSYVMWWASHRAGLASMVVGALVVFAVFVGALVIAYVMTRAAVR